jgi:hypothetical protein
MQSEPPTGSAAPHPADTADRRDYRWRVDRVAIARAERRRQATEELEFERDREAALREEIARLVLELEGPRLDEEVFAQLSPEDVGLVRGALQGEPVETAEEDGWFELGDEDPEAERAELEAEIVRLQGEIAASIRRQEAFERYLEALGE